MEIQTAKLVQNGVLLNGSNTLPDGSTGHVRDTYNEWLAEGNTPEPYTDPAPLPTTVQQQIEELDGTITKRNMMEALGGDAYALNEIDKVKVAILALREEF